MTLVKTKSLEEKKEFLLRHVFKKKNKKISPGQIFDATGVGPKNYGDDLIRGMVNFEMEYTEFQSSGWPDAMQALIDEEVVEFETDKDGCYFYSRIK